MNIARRNGSASAFTSGAAFTRTNGGAAVSDHRGDDRGSRTLSGTPGRRLVTLSGWFAPAKRATSARPCGETADKTMTTRTISADADDALRVADSGSMRGRDALQPAMTFCSIVGHASGLADWTLEMERSNFFCLPRAQHRDESVPAEESGKIRVREGPTDPSWRWQRSRWRIGPGVVHDEQPRGSEVDPRPNAGAARSSGHLAQLRQHTIRNTRGGADGVTRIERGDQRRPRI